VGISNSKKIKLVYDAMFELLNDKCACVVWIVIHHRPFNVEMHKRAQSNVDVTAGQIPSEVRKERRVRARIRNKFELVHMNT